VIQIKQRKIDHPHLDSISGENNRRCDHRDPGNQENLIVFGATNPSGKWISYRQFIDLLIDEPFVDQLCEVIANCQFPSLRFETPVLSSVSMDLPFQFALIDSPSLARRSANPSMFLEKFPKVNEKGEENRRQEVCSFWNLSQSSRLIVPIPNVSLDNQNETEYLDDFGHLASFLRIASSKQKRALWSLVGKELKGLELEEKRYWLSTAGGGVPWLHVRIDPTPKYYWHQPYKSKDGILS